MEWHTHPEISYFITLTYDDDHVPMTVEGVQTLERKKTAKWIQNLPAEIGAFRYYLVGEYGDESHRPHYHMALFPDSYSQVLQLTEKWKRGFTSTYPMAETRALYLAQYTTKKLTHYSDERLAHGQEPEFRTSSRTPPIGAPYVPILVSAYRSRAGQSVITERGDIERSIRFGGKILPIPRFILDRVRKELGIPLLHSERMAHPGYYEIQSGKEYAEWQPDEALAQEIQNAQKKKILSTIGSKV